MNKTGACAAGDTSSCCTTHLMLSTTAEAGFYPNPLLKVHGHGFNKRPQLHPQASGQVDGDKSGVTIRLSRDGTL